MEKTFLIPAGWKKTTIDDICSVFKGKGLSKGMLSSHAKNPCILYGQLFTTYSEVITNVKSRTDANEGVESRSGDVLLPGSTTTKAIDLARASALTSDGVLLGGDINILRKKDESYDPIFLAYYLTHFKTKEIGALGQGTTIVHLYGRDIKKVRVALPPLHEQEKIVEILSTVDEDIKKTDESIFSAEKLKDGLMQKLFTKGIGHTKFKKTKIGIIPEEWELKTIGDIKSFITSGSRGWAQYYASSGPIFLRIGNLTRKHVNLRLEDKVHVIPPSTGEGLRTRVRPGDVLISITADLGIVGLVPPTIGEAYVNQHIALVRFENIEVFSPWIAHFLSSSIAQKQFLSSDDRGTKSGLNLPKVENILIALPNRTEQEKIVNILTSIDQKIAAAHEIKTELISLKKSLTQDLLSGNVRVL